MAETWSSPTPSRWGAPWQAAAASRVKTRAPLARGGARARALHLICRGTPGHYAGVTRSCINTPGAPRAVGPYSQAVRDGDMVYSSGQIPLDPATGKLVHGDISVQTRRV